MEPGKFTFAYFSIIGRVAVAATLDGVASNSLIADARHESSLLMKMPLDPGFRLYMASVVGGSRSSDCISPKATGPATLNSLYLPPSTEAKPSLTN